MLIELIEKAIREKYEIPDNAENLSIGESIDYGCSCCGSRGVEVEISYKYIPVGKKRRVARYHRYSGTLWDLIFEMDT